MSFWVWAAVAIVGGIGATVRFVVDTAISQRFGRDFPFGTLTINLTGAFALGLLTGLTLAGNALLIAGTATIGSYTTFSTWMLETNRLAEGGEPYPAVLNVVLSIVAGVGAAALGRAIGGVV
jgi:CrcB protein